MDFKTYFKLNKGTGKRRHKYNAKSCHCTQGHIHDSRLEARHCALIHLMARDKTKGIVEIKRQVTFELAVNGKKICGHRVDFLLEYQDGKQEVIESKGFATPEWELKHRLFEAIYPEIKYTVWR